MNGLCVTNRGQMTEQEWEKYVSHLEMRNRQEQEKLELEKQRMRAYKETLIQDILERSNNHSLEDLQRMTVRSLERIFDYV
jgi:hypothetical protein